MVQKRKNSIESDPKYNNILVAVFINKIMRKGKKSLAQKIVYETFEEINKKTKKKPLEIFDVAIKNTSPLFETRPRRVGGATYQVPTPVSDERQRTLAMRWIVAIAKKKKSKKMKEKLAEEIILAAKEEGGAVKKKIETERMAEANKAFAHFAR